MPGQTDLNLMSKGSLLIRTVKKKRGLPICGSFQKAPCEINALKKLFLCDYLNTPDPNTPVHVTGQSVQTKYLNLPTDVGFLLVNFAVLQCASHHFRGNSHLEMSRITSERLSGEQKVSPLR